MRIRRIASDFIILILLWGFVNSNARSAQYSEYAVKAAFIYNFAKFIDWPENAFPKENSPLIVGVLGRDPFGQILDETFRDKTVHGRNVVLKRLGPNESCAECHLLFISSSESERVSGVLNAHRGANTVTISDMPGFDEKGGVIRLFTARNKVRFSINSRAANNAGVKLSSQLLKLSHSGDGA